MTHPSHDFQPAGTCDDGTRRYRCAACRIGATWPEANAKCGAIAHTDVPAKPPKAKRPHRHVVPGAPPNRVCQLASCAMPYHSTHYASRYCSQTCAKTVWNAQHAASQKRTETQAQRDARAVRQLARRRAEAARVAAETGKADDAATGRQEAAE